MSRDVVIVDAVRSPIGKFRGALADVRADHLGAAMLTALAQRTGVSPGEIDDVIFGCVTQVGEQCGNIALGHPLGATGARIMTTLLNEMTRRGARYGLQAICCAGGLGTATLVERSDGARYDA